MEERHVVVVVLVGGRDEPRLVTALVLGPPATLSLAEPVGD
jgi:hypothetical protein